MLKINNIDKYYDKGKSKELHVLKNISLSLPDKGLVSFLGSSGCGKTTLLNVLGGLDKASGEIIYDDLTVSKYSPSIIDAYRNKNISYIFQNYLLLPDLTVYDNLKLALEVMGVIDFVEVDERITYTLKAVGMYKYRKKLASALSGGQQQRVAIARALLKNVKIIFADEPTGNLDKKNSIEVMNILKKISEKTLVLLVTHSKELAEFYSDKIILLKDGSVVGEKLGEGTSLEHDSDDVIYLSDLEKTSEETPTLAFDIYRQTKEKLSVRVIEKAGKLYIDANLPIHIIDKNVIINEGKYEDLKKEAISDFSFDISWYKDSLEKKVSFAKKFKDSIIAFFSSKKKVKFFNACFFIMGIFLAISTIILGNSIYYNKNVSYLDNKYLLTDFDYENRNILETKLAEAYKNDYISNYVGLYSADVSLTKNSSLLDTNEYRFSTISLLFPFDAKNINKGNMPKLGEALISSGFKKEIIAKTGIKEENLIGTKVNLNYSQEFTISGITDESGQALYINPIDYNKLQDGQIIIENIDNNYYYKGDIDYTLLEGKETESSNEVLVLKDSGYNVDDFIKNTDFIVSGIVEAKELEGYYNPVLLDSKEMVINTKKDITVSFIPTIEDVIMVEGRKPTSMDECIVPEYYMNVGDTINEYKVVGTYRTDFNEVNNSIMLTEKAFIAHEARHNVFSAFSVNDASKLKELLGDLASFDTMYNIRINDRKEDRNVNLITSGSIAILLLAVTMIYIYFIMRSKMINVRYQTAVLRNIGASKRYVYREFLVELLTITIFTNLIGYLLTYIIYFSLGSAVNGLVGSVMITTNVGIFLIGLILIFVINFSVGILPIRRYLKKTPAEITALYDI